MTSQDAVGQDVLGQGETGQRRRGYGYESLSFHSCLSTSDTHPQPRIVYQHQQMTDKGTAQPQTGPHPDCGCVRVFVGSVHEWPSTSVAA